MTLATGNRLGPYEIVTLLGAGGMGEVYRARDARLEREVAIKVLPAALGGDPERQRRFEQEARATARLNHPNLLQIYDVGEHEGRPYLVTELLEGATLRERLEQEALTPRKAIELAIAIASGLAAAHEQGIVHRDLKPENLFVTHDGRLKILDFGLAKLVRPETAPDGGTAAPTRGVAETAAGLVLGTVGYMSPEQVRGQPVDPRSDLFSFGAILYEMLSGRRAFRGETPADTMSAILREDPPELGPDTQAPPVIGRLVRRCLEKNPAERFRSAWDLAFQLEAISGISGASPVASGVEDAPRGPATFRRLTYAEGFLYTARFAPDGQTVVYSAAWNGGPARVYMKRPESPEAIPLALPSADVHAISKRGEMALVLSPAWAHNGAWRGTLAAAPLFGGGTREMEERILDADWLPGGDDLVVVRDGAGRGAIEWPIGRPIHETTGHVTFPRVAPNGQAVAFLDHPLPYDDRGAVAVIDRQGKRKALTPLWPSVQGLAWSPSGEEIWFTATDSGSTRSLHAVTLDGRIRMISGFPGAVRVFDIAADGRVLMARDSLRIGVRCRPPDGAEERELSWLDWTRPRDLTPDGRILLLTEQGESAGTNYLVCVRGTDGSPVIRLGEGEALAISPDGRWALATLPAPESPLTLLPTGTGRPRTIAVQGVHVLSACWLPEAGRVLCVGRARGGAACAYLLHLNREIFERLPLEGADRPNGVAVAPDGTRAVLSFSDGASALLPLDGGAPRPGPDLRAGDRVEAFSADGEWLFVEEAPAVPRQVVRVRVASGERVPWRGFSPGDPTGVVHVLSTRIAADGGAYAYGYNRVLSELYVAEGLR
jgi:dipeptidyl aminopeptidase/acylaminoacyl peptidase